MRPVYVAVCGAGQADEADANAAEAVGRFLAQAGAVVVTGGMSGVMAAASRGAAQAGGTVLGILPGDSHADANPFVTVSVPTGLGEARNTLVVRTADAVIAVGGEYGTLSEIGFALKIGRAVIGLRTWELRRAGSQSTHVRVARTPEDAVRMAITAAKSRR
jgi:uncharacterized protein (TIGR00725 family)